MKTARFSYFSKKCFFRKGGIFLKRILQKIYTATRKKCPERANKCQHRLSESNNRLQLDNTHLTESNNAVQSQNAQLIEQLTIE